MKKVLSILVDNQAGVLSRVTGLIARRGFNIDSLSVGPAEDAWLSRITIVMDADMQVCEQITKQLNKLVSVHKIIDLSDDEAICRELILIKVSAEPEQRSEIIEIANVFRGKIVDVGKRTLTVEATGTESKLGAIEDLLVPYGIKEITRTGRIAVSRSSKQ